MAKKQIVKKSKFKLVKIYEETRDADQPQIVVELAYRGTHFTQLLTVGDDTLKYLNRDIRDGSALKYDKDELKKAYQLIRYEEK